MNLATTQFLSINPWSLCLFKVGFLSEAQIGGYPFDTVVHVVCLVPIISYNEYYTFLFRTRQKHIINLAPLLSHHSVMFQASKDFSDPRLKIHISTVLKGMQSRRKASSSTNTDTMEKRCEASFPDESICVPVELFRILAECEKQKNPGEAILMKAKELSWSILAMIASCFSDVSPISCLTVWLEITAARLLLISHLQNDAF